MVKILEVQIKVLDDKGHVKIFTKNDIELDSIVIKKSDTQPVKKEEPILFKVEPEKEKPAPKKKQSRRKKVTNDT